MDKNDGKPFLGITPQTYAIPAALAQDIVLIDEMIGRVLALENEHQVAAICRDLYEYCSGTESGETVPVDSKGQLDELLKRHPALGEPGVMSKVLRAYTIMFQLVNIAEQKEIVRANRQRQSQRKAKAGADDSPWRPESIGSAIERMAAAGTTATEMQKMLDRMEIVPTITAHPTEARRRVVMDKLLGFADALGERGLQADAPRLMRPLDLPLDIGDDELLRQLVALWNTDELRAGRVAVSDEVTNSVYFFQRTIFEVVAWLHQDLKTALARAYPDHEFTLGKFLRYHSWVGGDRDGNPNVTPDVTWSTVLYHQQVILSHYLASMEPLKRELSLSSRSAPPSRELEQSLQHDAETVNLDPVESDRFRLQPYALKTAYIERRLRDTLKRVSYLSDFRELPPAEASTDCPAAYKSAEEFANDLAMLQRSLQSSAARLLAESGPLHRLMVQANTFGFHLATLDVRQHSEEHERTLDEVFAAANVTKPGRGYASLPEEEKLALLEVELRSPRPLLPRGWRGTEKTMHALEVFDVIRRARRRAGKDSITAYVISMTHQVSDMLEVLVLAKEARLVRWVRDGSDDEQGHATMRLESDLDIVPLFETIEDLQHCDQLLNGLLENNSFRMHLQARGNFQELMLGYSDSSKDGGYLAANWNLQDTQDRLSAACNAAGIDFRFFHGRGGTVGRGGGRASRAILSQPKGSFSGRIRFTEQGEVVSFRYALRPMAHRHLEQIINSVLLAMHHDPTKLFGSSSEIGLATATPDAEQRNHDRFGPEMAEMAAYSRGVYRSLVHEDPEFWEFYAQATPIAHISQLPITSRPAARGGGRLNNMEELRAIPWVFAWVQSRYVVPGWYGLGAALEKYATAKPENLDRLRSMYQDWPFFKTVLDNAQLELVRTHLPTAAHYAGRVRPETLGARFHKTISEEYERARKWMLQITEQANLLDKSPVVQATVLVRNPVVLPLNKLQVALLELWEQQPETDRNSSSPWHEPMLLSITAVAAGMQSTG